MSKIVVNIASLNQSCENNIQNTNKLIGQKEQLEQVASKLYAKWEGGASRSYFNRYSEEQQTLENVIEGMKMVANFEHQAVTAYTKTNQFVDRMIEEMF